jgi:hypothetical protein
MQSMAKSLIQKLIGRSSSKCMYSTGPGFERIFTMDPSEGLADDQKEIFNMATKFSREQMKPHMAEWDRTETFPVDVMKQAAALGIILLKSLGRQLFFFVVMFMFINIDMLF